MRVQILSALLCFFTIVWAGGYQGCLERVLMYQAYLIDEINPPNERIMGFQCKGSDWDQKNKRCTRTGGFTEVTTGTGPRGRMTYDEFLKSLGKVKRGQTYGVFTSDGSLDIKATALSTYNAYTSVQPGQDPNSATVKNFGANTIMKDTGEWNDAIKKSSQVVERAYRNKGLLTDDQKKLFPDKLFTAFDETSKLTLEARIGDHGEHLIQEARNSLNPQGITVETKRIDGNPGAGGGATWDTVDWTKTITAAEASGMADARTKVQTAAKGIYANHADGTRNVAREHLNVIKSFQRAQDSRVACRP
ncbi:hypothetical protein CC86DRAFT_471573 [Ophiobolus disseminans]|uniref:Lysozyme-like protein n=1 Tax=Ophiobolus disseminans TaxID=1469910 RepID=A0A6A6ZHW7_9PLEO|nr:hypothetical protein CC86DRAFT_471573 [Ophiobolus disseminans]